MRKSLILSVLLSLLFVLLVVTAPAQSCWGPGCDQDQGQNIYGYQDQYQGADYWYYGGMVQSEGSYLGSYQFQSQSGDCHDASQNQFVSGYQGQGQEQITGFGYQIQYSEQSAFGWQSQY